MLKRFCIAKSLILHISKPKKIPGNIFVDISKVRKSSRRGLLCKIFDKLRIQGRMQIFEKKSQKALNHVLIGKNARSRCADFAGIFIIEKGAFCVELRPFYCSKGILVSMSYISLAYVKKSGT